MMLRSKSRIVCRFLLVASFAFLLVLSRIAFAQTLGSPNIPECGKAKVVLSNPEYLKTAEGIVVVEPPSGWFLDKIRDGPFYFIKRGESYSSARTLMYINVERLEGPLQTAVQNDARSFKEKCQGAEIEDRPNPQLLEQGCASKTQLFSCQRKQNAYVDLVTKIAFNGLLLNVVLSGDTAPEISKHEEDYKFLLMHLTLTK
jgi:hypothetical protein